jgi:protein-disulfide isomerase
MKNWIVAALVLGIACSPTAAQPAKQAAPGDVVATVGTDSITLAQVDEKALQQSTANFGSMRLGQALYEARRMAIDEIVATRLMEREAKSRSIDRATLVEKEIGDKVSPVSDADVSAWYQTNQSRVQGAPLDQVRAPIRAYLIQERMEGARQQFIAALKSKTPVKIMLDPPRVAVAATGPTKGQASAPIQMIEFSDFQCPYCRQANPTVARVLSTYGDRIHFVYRHYPLPTHPNAHSAAEASACAAEQGKFWPYHDVLFANPTKLGVADLKQHAADLGLDATTFNACVDSHKFKAQVDTDMKEGEEVGVNGTPAFFINGRFLSGAQPFEAFKRVIDEELERK